MERLRASLRGTPDAKWEKRPVARAPLVSLARPPQVTSGQLLRISLLVLASLIYADPSPFLPHWLKSSVQSHLSSTRGVDFEITTSQIPIAKPAELEKGALTIN
jgi:hypothetical protein